jgi:hypothetical protein
MSIVVYHLTEDGQPAAKHFNSQQLGIALSHCETLRKQGARHVTLSSEHSDSVGKPGVTAVEEGKTPDGQDYDWKKRRL